ncbi:nicotinate-nucleotide--dimethylbenzimidazole phosphoribosyltransferase [Actinomycetes bacterium KLBMP 9759]
MDLPPVPTPDDAAKRAAVARHAALDVPVGGLGRLAELGVWLAAAQGASPPKPLQRPRVVVVAGDHGIAAAGVSAHAPGDSVKQAAALREQAGAAAVVALVAGATVRVVDLALDTEPEGGTAERYRVRRGSGRIDQVDALTADETAKAVEIGRAIADEEVDAGADLLVPGSIGVGATTPASVLVAAITGTEPVAVIGRGSGIDDNGWMRKAAAVRDALRRTREVGRDPLALLRVAGGADLAALTGVLVQAALRRTPVLLDGVAVAAAALLADRLAPGARAWWRVAQASPEPVPTLVATHLGLTPIVELGVRLGDGSGAATVIPLLQVAARLMTDLAEVPVPEPEPEPVVLSKQETDAEAT